MQQSVMKTTVDRFEYPKGTKVVRYRGYDYGCSRDDTEITGLKHVTVTADLSGGTPFFTIPETCLEGWDG